jgi:uncharacterized protein YprB with RNaseH-like and TPR domain
MLGFQPEVTPLGTAWVRRVSVDLGPFLARASAGGPVDAARLVHLGCRAGARIPDDVAPDARITVLDIESLGLRGSGVLAFVVGLGVARGDHLDVDQLLVADPGEEAAMLGLLLSRVTAARLLVSYNGRSFDIPMLIARAVINRLSAAVFEERLHSDLLGPVRRLFRDRLGACTLHQAELGLLGFERHDDVPGYEAPARYRAWLRSGDPSVLEGVVRHNELDLCSTMVLAARLADHIDGRLVSPVHPADRYHLAVHLERQAVEETPEMHYRAVFDAAVGPWDRRAGHRLARCLDRTRTADDRRDEVVAIWRRLWSSDLRDLRAARGLAISLERRGALPDALAVSRRALDVSQSLPRWGTGRLRGEPPGGWTAEWHRRVVRLSARVERAEARRAIAS